MHTNNGETVSLTEVPACESETASSVLNSCHIHAF